MANENNLRPFQKGQSGNPNGRPKGAFNKTTQQVREWIADFLDRHTDQIEQDFLEADYKTRLYFYEALLKYILPRTPVLEPDKQGSRPLQVVVTSTQAANDLLKLGEENEPEPYRIKVAKGMEYEMADYLKDSGKSMIIEGVDSKY